MTGASVPLLDLPTEGDRVLAASTDASIELRLIGGLAVRRICPSAALPPLSRSYADLDLVVSSRVSQKAVTRLMGELGYEPHQSFNALRGDRRLYFFDVPNDRHVDVFVDTFEMCHTLRLKHRIPLHPDTLPPADLLLTKLQVVELNDKDILDLLAMLLDLPLGRDDPAVIDLDYLEQLWSSDWPLWRTCGQTLQTIHGLFPRVLSLNASKRVDHALSSLLEIHAGGRRTLSWKMRARVGDRVRWYELPEELG